MQNNMKVAKQRDLLVYPSCYVLHILTPLCITDLTNRGSAAAVRMSWFIFPFIGDNMHIITEKLKFKND